MKKNDDEKDRKNIKFEEALAELEQQVQLLESGELPAGRSVSCLSAGRGFE